MRAYLEGFQGGSAVTASSVACMTKHFPGGGPQKDGEDPHFWYGREQVYPTGSFEYHLEPFLAAIDAGTSAMMPCCGMPVGLTYRGRAVEEVGFGYSRQVIDGIMLQRRTVLDVIAGPGARIYVEGADPEAFATRGEVVDRIEDATVAVVRLGSPFEFRDTIPIESAFHAGTLAFDDDVVEHVRELAVRCPVVVEVTLDRPAVLTDLVEVADTVVGTFVVGDAALAHVLTNPQDATGVLPFDLPRDVASVIDSAADAPYDLTIPLYRHASWRAALATEAIRYV